MSNSQLKAAKLKPINEKLTQSRVVEKQNYLKQSGNMEWIKDLTKKQHQKVERPARSPQRLNESMRKNPPPLEISPKKVAQL